MEASKRTRPDESEAEFLQGDIISSYLSGTEQTAESIIAPYVPRHLQSRVYQADKDVPKSESSLCDTCPTHSKTCKSGADENDGDGGETSC